MICGSGGLQNVILVTTMWDSVDEQTGYQREKELQTNFWKSMFRSGSKMARFDSTFECAWRILDQFTGVRRPLQLQVEMVDERKPLVRTAAGIVLFQWLEQLVTKIRAAIIALRRLLRNAPKGSNTAAELRLQKSAAQEDLYRAGAQITLLSKMDKEEQAANARRVANERKKVAESATEVRKKAALKEREGKQRGGLRERMANVSPNAGGHEANRQVLVDKMAGVERIKVEEDTQDTRRVFDSRHQSHRGIDLVGFASIAHRSLTIINSWKNQERFVCWLLTAAMT